MSEVDEKTLIKKHLDLEGKKITDLKTFTTNSKFLKYLDLNYYSSSLKSSRKLFMMERF